MTVGQDVSEIRPATWPRSIQLVVLAIVAFYVFSLGYGFLWDDQFEMQRTWASAAARIFEHPRPVYYLFLEVTNSLFDQAWPYRLTKLLLFAVILVQAARLVLKYDAAFPALAVGAAFLHPTFVYPVTWIAMSDDLLVICFTLLTVLNVDRTRGFWYLILSDLSKAPFVLHDLWYIGRRWHGNRVQALAALIIPFGLLLIYLLFWFQIDTVATSPMAHLTADGPLALLFTLAVRGLKLLEAIVLCHMPFEGYWGAVPTPVLLLIVAAYLGAWFVLLRSVFTRPPRNSMWWQLLLIGLLEALPFAINSDPRVLGPAIPFFVLGWFLAVQPSRATGIAAAVLVALNLGGAALNYHLSDTGAMTFDDVPEYKLCGDYEMQIPMERWRCERSRLAQSIVAAINDRLS